MRFLVNGANVARHPTGLGVYSRECISAITAAFHCTVAAPEYLQFGGDVNLGTDPRIAVGGGLQGKFRRLIYSSVGLARKFDLSYTPTQHGFFNARDQIVTIHDLIALRYPEQNPVQALFFRRMMPKILKTCAAVFVVSEATRNEVVSRYKYPIERIHVVPNGVEVARFAGTDTPLSDDPFLLVVGAHMAHKNIAELFHEHESWKHIGKLKIVGGKGDYAVQLAALAQSLGIADRVELLDLVSDEQLVELYRGAIALVYPSLAEGFGIPPLEALAAGRPAIVSDIPVHRGIFGDAVTYIRLGESASWRDALANPGQGIDPMAVQALLQRYTWQRSHEILIDALLKVRPALQSLRR